MNTIKLSNTVNFSTIISSHNKKLMRTNTTISDRTCNCPNKLKPNCPLDGKCLAKNIIYKTTVTSNKDTPVNYIGLSSITFKERLGNHNHSFKSKEKSNFTELSKYIWKLYEKGATYNIIWSILHNDCRAPHSTTMVFRFDAPT